MYALLVMQYKPMKDLSIACTSPAVTAVAVHMTAISTRPLTPSNRSPNFFHLFR